jgi:hypothetical protein
MPESLTPSWQRCESDLCVGSPPKPPHLGTSEVVSTQAMETATTHHEELVEASHHALYNSRATLQKLYREPVRPRRLPVRKSPYYLPDHLLREGQLQV